MKSVFVLAGLCAVQGRLFDSPVPRSKIKFLGSGLRHSGENFHAVISAKSMDDVKGLTVTYSDCGNEPACSSMQTFLTDIPVGDSEDSNPKATKKNEMDGDYKLFDVEYKYTGSTLRNHILTVFSDDLGEESIICGVGSEINTGESANACNGCAAGSTFANLYDAQCKNCTQTCEDGKRVSAACTTNTDTACSGTCTTKTCHTTHYVSTACDHGSASEASSGAGDCASCLPSDDCTGPQYVSQTCVRGSTYVAGSPAVCTPMTPKNQGDSVTHYLNKSGVQGDADTVGSDNQWVVCAEPEVGQYVTTKCLGSLGANTLIETCRDCGAEHRKTEEACVSGDHATEGTNANCGACLEGFTESGGNCVSQAYMFGYVIRKDGATCAKKCVKWSGTLNDNFAESKISSQAPSEAICALLSDREPLLRSSGCPR